MKSRKFFSMLAIVFAFTFLAISCNDADKSTTTTTVATEAAITNPLFAIAPQEYATMAEQSFNLLAAADFEAWGGMLSDDVEYWFPDGDQNSRTKLKGKQAVLAWWKEFRGMPAVKSMTMSEFNNMPINVTGDAKGGAAKGIYVISYFTNAMEINGQSVGIRMNFSTHFNADKKIDRYMGYYDRTPIVKALGKNLLEEKKSK